MLKATFVRLALLCVLISGAAHVLAQNCGGAVPEFDYQPQACPSGTAGAYARFGPPPNYRWDSYQWSISAGTIVSGANSEQMQYIAPASGTVDITLTVVGGSGCGGTVTHTVAVTSEQNANIFTESAICPTSMSSATAMYGSGIPGATYSWSILNGTLYGPTNGQSVQYISGASGSMQLSVDVTTPNNCNGHGTVVIPIQPPTASIETWGVEAACPDRVNAASFYSSAYGTNVLWTATHATIIGSPMEPSVSFVPDGTGDVTLTANGSNPNGCATTATRTLLLQAPVVPQLVANVASVCPNGDVSVNVANANEFQNFTWSISAGSLSPAWPQASATIHSNGGGFVRVRVRGRLNSGCETESSIEIPIRLPDATVHAPASVGPNSNYVVSVADAGASASYLWDVTGGSLLSTNANEATVAAGASGTPRASVRVQSGGCEATGYADTNVAAGVLIPTIHTAGNICGGAATASVDNAANYATYAWQITNGAIDGPANGPSIAWHATSSADVTLSVHVTGASGAGDATKTISPQNAPAPMIGFSPANICGTNGTITATLMNASSYTLNTWSATNAVIDQRSEYGDWVTFHPLDGGPAVLSVDAQTAAGCTVTGSATLPSVEPVTPILQASPTAHCGINSPITVQITNHSAFEASSMRSYSWIVRNGIVQGPSYGSSITVVPTSNADVEVSVNVLYDSYFCRTEASITIPGHAIQAPVITLSAPEVCPYGEGTASVPATYGSYYWSIAHGTFTGNTWESSVHYRSDGTGPVTLSVTVWSPDSCSLSTSTTIPVKTIAPPVITLSTPEVCPYGESTASVPSTYGSYYWSIQNGTIVSATWEHSITYRSDGTGPVKLFVTVWSVDSCSSSSNVTIPLKSIPPPVITLSSPEVCPYGESTASVPNTYGSYYWSIQHGTIVSPTWENQITYRSDGSGPVTLSVTVWSVDACSSSSSATVSIKSIPPPVITLSAPEVCPYGAGTASVPPEYGSYYWSIQNGTITSPTWENQVTYHSDGTGPVTLSVTVWSVDACSSSSSVTVPLKTIPPPVITLDRAEVCPNGGGTASVPNTYGSYYWSIEHGTITSATWENSIIYRPDGSGPVKLTVTVWSVEACSSSSNVTIPLKTIPPPPISLDRTEVCPNGGGMASVPPDYASYSWSVTNGTITSNAYSNSIVYRPNGAGPVSLFVTVESFEGCPASNSATVPLKSIAPPQVTLDRTALCPATSGMASVPPEYLTYSWSIENGTITSSPTGNSVIYRAGDSGAVRLIVSVESSDGCPASTSVVVPIQVVATPTITASGPTTFCDGGSVTLTASAGSAYLWSNGDTSQSITIAAPGPYTVTVTDANGCIATSAATNVVRETPPTIDITAPASICDGTTSSATVNGAAGGTIVWSATNATITGGQGTATITFTPNSASMVTLNASVTSGTCTVAASKNVAANALPQFTLDVRASGSYNLRAAESSLRGEAFASNAVHDFCGVDTVSLTASVLDPSWTYVWSTGATGPHLAVHASGTYTLTATNAAGCSYSQSETVTMNPAPSVSISGGLTICPGGSTTLTASGGSSYLWSNGATTASITVTQAGTYSVTATSNGCSAGASVNVSEVAAAITAGGPVTFCHGGSVTLTANAAQSYLWSNGATTQSITVTEGGAYSVAETFAAGCSLNAAPVVVSVGPASAAISADRTTVCPNDSITFTSTITGGSNLTLQWLDGNGAPISGANGATLVLTPQTPGYGSVSLRATDANGCAVTSSSITYYRLDPPKPVITPSRPSTTFCAGGNITLESSAGAAYLWSTGATTRWITVAESGTYSVTVTDGSGCHTASDPVTVTVLPAPPAPVITADGPLTFCEGGSVHLTGPDGYAQYSWSTGEHTQSITVSTTRPVTLTVINADGCDATSGVQVTANPLPSATITPSGPTTFCEGGSVTLTAPAASSYSWSNGATTQSINVITSGSYSVTVTNANGCSATSAATSVTVNPLPTATITPSGPTTFCAGGSVTLTAPAAASYSWSTGATTQSINVTASGSYSVTITNASGCSATSAATSVTVNALPTATITPSGPTTFCAGGSVTLTAPAAASYSWSTGATTQSINVTASGSYSVTVTNANGCSATSAATSVTVNPLPTATITPSGPTTFCAGGSVTLTAPAAASYSWSTGATTQSINVTASGSYSVTVTNANGCSATSAATTVTVNALPSTTITPSGPTTFCAGGSVTLTAPAAASYSWSTGATTQSINVTTSGSYSVTITNANGCSATSAATTVTVNAKPSTPTITPNGPTTFCAGGSVTLTAPAGFTYLWSTGATTQSINATTSGSYSVTVSNANGCGATSAATAVTVNPLPSTTITPSGPTTFCAGGSVTLTAPAAASYSWSTGATTQSINVTTSGSYSVTVTNANGCSATSAPTNVTVNAKPATPTITPGGPTTFCEGGSVTLTAPAGFTYLWSTGATTQSINATTSGSYSVTVSNASGCGATSAATTVTVNAAPAVPVITPSGPTALCPGASVTLTAPAGFTYLWSNGATTRAVTVSTAGSYSVTVTNASGCSRTSAPTAVTTNAPTVITVQPANKTLNRNTTWTITMTATGTPTLTYQWYNGNSGDASSPVAGGTSSSLDIGPFTKKGTNRYWVRVSSSTCTASTVNSNTATITVN